MQHQGTCTSYATIRGSKGVHPQLGARSHGVEFTSLTDGFTTGGLFTTSKVFELEILIGDDVREHNITARIDTNSVDEVHDHAISSRVFVKCSTGAEAISRCFV